jgi:cytochrome c-type biogenesis protein CcsB
MRIIEALTLWASLGFYTVSSITYLISLIFKKDKYLDWGWKSITVAFAIHTLAIITRWLYVDHVPVIGRYEHTLLGGWAVIAVFWIAARKMEKIKLAGIFLAPFVILMIGHGLWSRPTRTTLTPPYKSGWLWIHITFAWFAYGAFITATFLAVIYLLKLRKNQQGRVVKFYERFADLPLMEDLIVRLVAFGFVAQTIDIASGSIWAAGLWGSYWGWDPVETWSLLVWIIYAIILHLRFTLGWKGKKLIWLVAAAIIIEAVSFGGFGYMGSVHTPLLIK